MRSNEVAKMTGVSVRTLRHYHQLGLLPEPVRSDNGYRNYSAADVARVLRIKRLASLGFPLARIGEILDDMDAANHESPDRDGSAPLAALDELDQELAREIERLQEQRRTIAALRAENLSPDLPVRFAQALRLLTGTDALADMTPEDRTTLLIAGHLYDDREIDELERVIEDIEEHGLSAALRSLDERMAALSPDAPESQRAVLAADALAKLTPLVSRFDAHNWLRPATDRDRFLDEVTSAGLNPAQQDVYHRIECGIEEIMRERTASSGGDRREA